VSFFCAVELHRFHRLPAGLDPAGVKYGLQRDTLKVRMTALLIQFEILGILKKFF